MKLAIKFTDQSPSFTYGVEFGRLLEKMERGDEVIKNNGFPIRQENCETIKMACIQYGYIAQFGEPYMDGWVDFIAIKNTTSNN